MRGAGRGATTWGRRQPEKGGEPLLLGEAAAPAALASGATHSVGSRAANAGATNTSKKTKMEIRDERISLQR